MTRQHCIVLLILLAVAACSAAGESPNPPFRPPAVPLVTHHPYFSTWSMTDRLTDDWPRHWTGAITGMGGMARIDGKTLRFMGAAPGFDAMDQKSVEVTPTRTIYRFESHGVGLTLTFMSPLLPHDLDLLARPVTYITMEVRSADGKSHDVRLYLEACGEWAVNSAEQQVRWARFKRPNLRVLSIGTEEQPVLKRAGDGVKIDWGYFCVAASGATDDVMAPDRVCRAEFSASGKLPDSDDIRMPRAASDDWPELAFMWDLGLVGESPVSRHAILAYDEIYAVEYMQRRLRPYWRRTGMHVGDLLDRAERDYPAIAERCVSFDRQLMNDLSRIGGPKYARLCALAYRQCLAGCGFAADFDGTLLIFPKENSSNGCIGTVDVIYPASPFFLLFNPEMLKAQLIPVLEYARSARWRFRFAPHDLGTYPLANGQVYGGREQSEENQMPVEESGNMILMIAALAKIERNADFAAKYWPLLTTWAEYLLEKGLDPENQLCTDDFTGHLAHNANLSIKAIEALGAYSMLCDMLGHQQEARKFRSAAEDMAAKWTKMADDGNHYRLAFDRPGTWSQKYNLVWDRILGLNLFSPDVARKEITFYTTKQQKFGLPLDSRSMLTKADWLAWTATMAESDKDFRAFVDPLYEYVNRTTKRVVFTDLYHADNPDSGWLHARPVIGGIYMKMLSDAVMWNKWARGK